MSQAHERLEVALCEWLGRPVGTVVAVSSGTAALHLALEVLRVARVVPEKSKILIPNFTMVACARAATLADLTPVFVDCDERLCLDSRALVGPLCEGARGIMPVHIYGRRCSIVSVPYGILVEDMAEAHGVSPYPFSDAACYSFYKNKIIAGEEGGAILFRYPEDANLARQLRSLGFTPEHDFTHTPRGHNYRLANCLAELILGSLSRFEENLLCRKQIEEWYNEICPAKWKMPPRDVPWVYDIRIPELTHSGAHETVKLLNSAGVEARHSFFPMSFQKEYRGCETIGGDNALRAASEVIYLPITPLITRADVTASIGFLTDRFSHYL